MACHKFFNSSGSLILAALKENINELVQYLKDSKGELKKVTWPSRKATLGLTWVVLLTVFIISLYLGIVDLGLTKIIKFILSA
ncbi:MAG: preprotein translocase subunit SecE [Deltaproteobacteria bacterium]|nr:preprotein translocase subunit SecE [Deltaproteobacteria bacterium]